MHKKLFTFFCIVFLIIISLAGQNLGISQSQRLRFNPVEAASYPGDRSDVDRAKNRDADTGKNQVLTRERYMLPVYVNWKSAYVKTFLFLIPQKEKSYLKDFFSYLNVFSGTPFVLNETKPLTTAYLYNYKLMSENLDRSLLLTNHSKEFFYSFHPTLLKINKGLEVWKKYAPFFPSKNIVINITETKFPEPAIIIIIFNEKLLRETINKHQDDFVKILGEGFDCDAFMNLSN